jgi:hypothetical protein
MFLSVRCARKGYRKENKENGEPKQAPSHIPMHPEERPKGSYQRLHVVSVLLTEIYWRNFSSEPIFFRAKHQR